MQYRTAGDILVEGVGYHKQASEPDAMMSREERKRLYAKAEYCYQFVLEQCPDDAITLAALGSLYVEIGKWSVGVALLREACRLDDKSSSNWNALGAGLRRIYKLDEARVAYAKALELADDLSEAAKVCHNMAGTYINEGEPEKAVEWGLKGLSYEPDNKALKFHMGMAYLELGRYAEGWDGYEMGRIATTWQRNYSRPGHEVAAWDGSPGKNVVVFGEQGVGDEILFAHALPDLIKISKSVVIECHPRLVALFKNSFPGLAVYGTRKDESITWPADHPELDAKVPIGSLHRFFRRTRDDFPIYPEGYIRPDPALVGKFAGKPGTVRVGVSWIGGTRDTHVALRSMPLERLGPILSIPGIEFVSLQYTDKAGEEVQRVREKHGWNITHDDAMNADLDQLFACIKGLDLIVTVLTSNVHFAGSMGVPAWIMTPVKAPWQFTQSDMPWYPQHQIFRQKNAGDWDEVIARIAANLRARTMRQAAE